MKDIKSNNIKINNKTITFPFKVYEAAIMDDRIIVSYNWSELEEKLKGFDRNRAIWCYDLDGNILWYVEKPYYIDKNKGEKVSYDQPVDSLGCNAREGKIFAYSRRGYELDPYTGKLSNDFDLKWK
jgi:hypothetical protein